MEGRMTVIVDEELMLNMARELLKKSRAERGMFILATVICIPMLVFLITITTLFWLSEKYIPFSGIALIVADGLLLWLCVYGYQLQYLHRWKKEMKKLQFPIKQNIEFGEEGITVYNCDFMRKWLWENIDVVCENDEYWFMPSIGIIIEKGKLTLEQFQFLSKKCKMIGTKKKRI